MFACYPPLVSPRNKRAKERRTTFVHGKMQRAFLSLSPLRRLPSTVRHQSTISTAEASSPSLFQRVFKTVWSTEGIVVASAGFGVYSALFNTPREGVARSFRLRESP